MYSNIGGKIKSVAGFLAIVGALSSIIFGISILDQGNKHIGSSAFAVPGWFVIVGGCIVSWISTMLMYGFGELIERTQKIHRLLVKKHRIMDKDVFLEQEQSRTSRAWKCPACGHVNSPSSHYCERCRKA